jgi:1,4-dihydroxy-2-naphthoate octaprenyltransferase
MTDKDRFRLLEHLRPMHLLTALALYLLGAGLAHYLGARFEIGLFSLGLVWLALFLEGFFFLGDYLQAPFQESVFPLQPADRIPGEARDPGSGLVLLYSALGLLTGTAALTAALVVNSLLTAPAYGLMALYFSLMGALIVPGLQLDRTGLGEFAVSLCLVVFPPALAFLPQYGGFHRYLLMAVFPLFPLHLALILSLRLRSYAEDLQAMRRTLLVRTGWKKGVFLHNLLVLSGFLLFGSAVLFGLPLRIAGPVFSALIPAAYLVWYYSGLERGAPARWPLIITLALVVFTLPVYLLLFAAWIY